MDDKKCKVCGYGILDRFTGSAVLKMKLYWCPNCGSRAEQYDNQSFEDITWWSPKLYHKAE